MKLFLTSAGITPEITDEFLKLLAKLSKDCRMVFVPTVPAPRKWSAKLLNCIKI